MPKRQAPRHIVKAFGCLAMLAFLAIGALSATLWLEHRIEIVLPTPTGPFAVGRAIYAWTDNAPDPVAPLPGTKRELVVWIWYPSAARASDRAMADYVPGRWRAAMERDRGALLTQFLTRDLSQVRAHSIGDSDVSPQQRAYPVLIMRAGASAEVVNYSTLAEDLASHGYVVVGFDAPYRTHVVVFPDGRVIRRTPQDDPEACLGRRDQESCADRLLAAWTADIVFVIDRLQQLNSMDASGKFTGRLDLTRIGVFGHSFGGAAAAQFCSQDSRCQAGVDVDGAPHGSVIQAGMDRPFLFLLSDHGQPSDAESRQVMADIRSIYSRLPQDGRLEMEIRGANHFGFSDDGALLKSHIVLGALRMLGIVGIDGRRQLAVTAYCLRSFFDACLKGPGVPGLKIASPLYPEIQVVK